MIDSFFYLAKGTLRLTNVRKLHAPSLLFTSETLGLILFLLTCTYVNTYVNTYITGKSFDIELKCLK